MELRIGDRFRDMTKYKGDIWEIVSYDDIKGYHNLIATCLAEGYWIYLGNYSKVDKFTELYNIMNS